LGDKLERRFAVPPHSQRSHHIGDEEMEATSIETFCRRHGISVASYYNLRAQGLAPREAFVGGRRLITKESAARWRRDREGFSEAAS
jgi:diketogulonate reductase-like aldo/keto reductase